VAAPLIDCSVSGEAGRIVCCSEVADPCWRWIADELPAPARFQWTFFSGLPRGRLERAVLKPRLSRYRACWEAGRFVRRARPDLLVTHHPLVSAWTEAACRGRACPHVAFSFNFTALPTGVRRAGLRRVLRSVDRFTVFSEYERRRYSEFFGLPPDRFDRIDWGIHVPPPPGVPFAGPAQGYACAVGSQARDLATLSQAMRRLPDVELVLITHAENVRDIVLPPNVSLKLTVPREEALAAIAGSRFMVLPLVSRETACGHVTVVTAMHYGRAIVATESWGLADYLRPGENALQCPPGDPAALADAIRRLWDDPAECARLGAEGARFARQRCTERSTVSYFESLVQRYGLAPVW
jgi:glycosyltransferase involved in cell wall biosynthesis